jgi:hypothetical protein
VGQVIFYKTFLLIFRRRGVVEPLVSVRLHVGILNRVP